MSSWNWPTLKNKVVDDVAYIKQALNALLKMNPSDIQEDVPIGAKRLQDTQNGVQLQKWDGSAWVSVGDIDSNVASADKLKTSRSITLSGDVEGTVAFDGSSNVTMTTQVADDSHNHTIANIDGLQDVLDTLDAGETVVHKEGEETISGAKTFTSTIVGNITSADKLSTARTITVDGDASGSVSFDGSADVSLTLDVAELNSKADKATTLAGYGIEDAYTKTEANSAIATEIAKVVADAPESFDTLKEIADWIGNDTSGAAKLASDIADLKADKAEDSAVVHKTGNETISGTKTFSDDISGNITGNAATATKATQDGSGNTITTTYVTKSENISKLNTDFSNAKIGEGLSVAPDGTLNAEKGSGVLYYDSEPESLPTDVPDGTLAIIDDGTDAYYANVLSKIQDVDDGAVHKTGDEEIGGRKTFTDKINGSSIRLNSKHPVGEDSWSESKIDWYDSTNNRVSFIEPRFYANGKNELQLRIFDTTKTPLVEHKAVLASDGVLAVDDKPLATDESVVHKTGNEAFSGVKTHYEDIIDSTINMRSNLVDYTDISRTDRFMRSFRVNDKNNKILGDCRVMMNTNGSVDTQITAKKNVNGSEVTAALTVSVDNNGNKASRAITPSVASNSSDIATTAWCNNRFAHEGDLTIYVRKTGNDSNDGLSETTAKLTINAALKVARAYNVHSGTTKIDIGEGVWNESIVIRGFNARSISAQALTFIGAGIDKTIISANSAHTVLCTRLSSLSMQDLTLENTSTDKLVVQCTVSAEVVLLRCRLRGNYTIALAEANSSMQFTACKLNSLNNTACSISSTRYSVIYVNNETEINGSFSSAVMSAYLGGLINISPSANITGNCIGKRYNVYKNGIIDSFGQGAEAIPGTIAGTVSTGGQYI